MAMITDFDEKVGALADSDRIFYTGWPETGKTTGATKLSKLKHSMCIHLDRLRDKSGHMRFGEMKKLTTFLKPESLWVVEGSVINEHRKIIPMAELTVWHESSPERLAEVYNKRAMDFSKGGFGADFKPDLEFGLKHADWFYESGRDIKNNFADKYPVMEIGSFEEADELIYCLERQNGFR